MKRLVITLGVFAAMFVVSCSSERLVTTPDNADTPFSIQGKWQGVLAFTAFFDNDSISFRHVLTNLTFADSTWEYYHSDDNGDRLSLYGCNSELNRYNIRHDTVHLDDMCPYLAIVDPSIMYFEDYSFELSENRLLLRYSQYSSHLEADLQQVVDLRRVSD
ncbi:MAG: hypothetical protein DRP45_01620 [Candidatus Zixiibacteriota bacterium]|nr:MAG: hypothetical protein DRP45_01620 [candidate division Zixibacteria bacterium]